MNKRLKDDYELQNSDENFEEEFLELVESASYESDLDPKKKVVVKGVMGMKSKPFTKKFKNMAAAEKWMESDDAGDYSIQQVMNEENEDYDEDDDEDEENEMMEEYDTHEHDEDHPVSIAHKGLRDSIVSIPPAPRNVPFTKAGMLKDAYEKMKRMKKGELQEFMRNFNESYEDVDMDDIEEEINLDIQNLVNSEESLSESFKEKATVIFEAALGVKVKEEVQRLEEEYAQELSEETQRIENHLISKIDSYLDYVISEWVEENRIAIESGIRTQIAESFMSSLKDVFLEHYIEVPESKIDLVDELSDQLSQIQEELDKSISKNIKLSENIKDLTRDKLISEIAYDLTESQTEKLKTLSEGVSLQNVDDFISKVETIKDFYFSDKKNTKKSSIPSQLMEETEFVDLEDEEKFHSPSMERYLSAFKKSKTFLTRE
jgi:hypothetical protein